MYQFVDGFDLGDVVVIVLYEDLAIVSPSVGHAMAFLKLPPTRGRSMIIWSVASPSGPEGCQRRGDWLV